MSTIAERKVGALLGSLISDAAALPIHWMYDAEALAKIIAGAPKDFAFLPNPSCGYYHLETGKNSIYGDVVRAGLMALSASGGETNFDTIKASLRAMFGGEFNAYQRTLVAREAKVYPVAGPWISHTLISFLENADKEETGCDSNDTEGFMLALPFVLNAVKDEDSVFPADEIRQIMKVLISKDLTADYSLVLASVLFDVVATGKLDMFDENKLLKSKYLDVVKDENKAAILEEFKDVAANLVNPEGADHTAVVRSKSFGCACPNPGNTKGVSHSLGLFDPKSDTFKDVLLRELAAGGDNCSRSNPTGAFMGALVGVPSDWVTKYSHGLESTYIANKLWGTK